MPEPAVEVALAAGVLAGSGVEAGPHAATTSITASIGRNPDRLIDPWSPHIGSLSNVPGSVASVEDPAASAERAAGPKPRTAWILVVEHQIGRLLRASLGEVEGLAWQVSHGVPVRRRLIGTE